MIPWKIIICSIKGSFERKSYILEEPKVEGFNYNKEGETTWPKIPERKTFLIGKCRRKIEIDDEPLLLSSSTTYRSPLDTMRKGAVDQAISNLPSISSITEAIMSNSKNTQK